MSNSIKKQGRFYAWPMAAWFTLFFVAPLLIIIAYSFMKRNVYGGVIKEFSIQAYIQMFNPAYAAVFLRTLWISALSTLITLLIALPCGYAMARSRHQTLFLILVIVPFWTNSLIRIFSWMTILGNNGIINHFLLHFGFAKDYAKLLYTRGAVILVSIYMYLPYAILPIFTAVDRFDFSLLEAARDLGAKKMQSLIKILLPGIKSGLITTVIFTFIPIFGAYTVPLLVGGKDSYMLGNIIVDQVQKVRNWPLAAAFSMMITIISVAGVMAVLMGGKKDEKKRIEFSVDSNDLRSDLNANQIFSVQKFENQDFFLHHTAIKTQNSQEAQK